MKLTTELGKSSNGTKSIMELYLGPHSDRSVQFIVAKLFTVENVAIIKSRRMRWAGHVARMGQERNVYRLLLGKTEGRRPLGTPRRKWIDNMKINLDWSGSG
jgi:hypothetical protein